MGNWASSTYTAGNFFHTDWSPLQVIQSASASDHYISFPFTIPTTVKNIGVFVWSESSLVTGNDFTLSQPILSDRSSPQQYIPPPYQQELDDCLRRFCKTFAPTQAPIQAINSAAGAIHWATPVTGRSPVVPWFFPREMGKEPTVTTYNPVSANANWRDLNNSADRTATIQAAGPKMVRIVMGSCAVSEDNIIHASASAEPCV